MPEPSPRFSRTHQWGTLGGTLAILLAGLILSSPARAELGQGADTLAHQGVSFGGFAEVYGPAFSRPASFMLIGQFSYGTSDRWNVESDLGLGMLDTLIGFYAKYRLIREDDSDGDHWSGALRAGIHNQVNLYGDVYLIVSRMERSWEAYVSPYLSIPVVSASASTPTSFGLVPGVSFAMGKHSRLYFEANLNLGASYNSASFGLRENF